MIGQQRRPRPAPMVDATWRSQAGWRFADLHRFFPAGNAAFAVGEIGAAKAICGVYQVQVQVNA